MTIIINTTQVDNALAHLQHQITNLQPAMNAIGQNVKTHVGFAFKDHKSPEGVNWKVLSPITIAKRTNGSSEPLNDTGVLKNSFTVNAGANFVEIGTNSIQAAMMNFGGSKATYPNLWGDVLARPFFPTSQFPANWNDDIIDILQAHFA